MDIRVEKLRRKDTQFSYNVQPRLLVRRCRSLFEGRWGSLAYINERVLEVEEAEKLAGDNESCDRAGFYSVHDEVLEQTLGR